MIFATSHLLKDVVIDFAWVLFQILQVYRLPGIGTTANQHTAGSTRHNMQSMRILQPIYAAEQVTVCEYVMMPDRLRGGIRKSN